ncbi:MAG: response regulator [Planctomycetes bacterium]|nr:response regulator [Planctomycetota bacterium]
MSRSREKILIVDDSKAILAFAGGILEEAGYSVVTSTNPIAVAGLVRTEAPDMVLMDIQMPAISGTDVVATLNRFGSTEGIRMVLFSASVSEAELAIRAESVGAHGYIHKAAPLSPESLVAAVGRLLLAPLTSTVRPDVLVVDDSRAIRILLALMLREQGYDVTCAADGREALEHLREKKPQFAIVDLEMPEMDGLELIVAMRKQPDFQHIPVLLVTAVRDAKRIQAVLAAGACGYLNKPVDKATIVDRIRAMGA